MWTVGQQSRLPVPTGTPTAGIHHPALFARPHLDRHPAYLYPWVLVQHPLFAVSLYRSVRLCFSLPLWHLSTVYLHCWLLRHFLFLSPLSWWVSLSSTTSLIQPSCHNFWPLSRLLAPQSICHFILRKLLILIPVILSELPEALNTTNLELCSFSQSLSQGKF